MKELSACTIFVKLSVKLIWIAMFWVLAWVWFGVCWVLAFCCSVVGVVVPVWFGLVWFGLFLSCLLAAGLNGLVVRGGSEFGKRRSFYLVLISLGSFLFLFLSLVGDVEGIPPVKLRGFGSLEGSVSWVVSLF